MSFAIVHDHLVQRGGAERVALSLAKGFRGTPIHTSFYSPDLTYPGFADVDVRPLPINRLSVFRARHRLVLPLLAPSFSMLSIEADLTLCSSAGWSHGVRTTGRKVVYCHSPARWLYSADDHLRSARRGTRVGARLLRRPLYNWDQKAMATADLIIANSNSVRTRIVAAYGREAEVVFPPFMVQLGGPETSVDGVEPGFFLCVSRLMPYKNVRAIVEAFAQLPSERLIIVGSGPQYAELRGLAGANVRFFGNVEDGVLRWLYRSAFALVAASFEDFGLTPLEAAAYGKPSIALRYGGFLDTIVEGSTGVFFDAPEAAMIASAVREGQSVPWSPSTILTHVESFSEMAFHSRLREIMGTLSPGFLCDPG